MKKKIPVRAATTFLSAVLLLTTVLSLIFAACRTTTSPQNADHTIIVEATFSKWFHRELDQVFVLRDEIPLRYMPFPLKEMNPYPDTIEEKVKEGKVRWVLYSEQPIKIYPPFGDPLIMYPGDSVHILYKANYPDYSGKNTQALALIDTLVLLEDGVLKPHKKYSYNADNLKDFLDWNRYLNEKTALLLPVIESFKNKVSNAEYDFYKSHLIGSIESERIHAFGALYQTLGNSNLTRNDLIQIWDSTQNSPARQWLHSLSEYNGSVYDIYTYVWMELKRQAGFDLSIDSLQSKEVYTYTLYNKAKNSYKGQLRERLLARILDEEVILEMGLKNPTTQAILKDYYSQPGYPEFKAWVNAQEKKKQRRDLEREKKKDKEKPKVQAEEKQAA